MNTEKIKQLNDMLRKTFIGGQVMLTTGIRVESEKNKQIYTKLFLIDKNVS